MSGTEREQATREIELKLEVNARDVAVLLRQPMLSQANALPDRSGHFHAVYYDTPDEALRRAGLSLRVRRENGRFVQTVKAERAPLGIALDRAEWQCVVRSGFEPAMAKETPLAPFLADPDMRKGIRPRFIVDTRRRAFMIARQGSEIELAFDTVKISAGSRSESVREIELELKKGNPSILFAVARALASALPLRLSLTAKSDRGYALLEAPALCARRAQPLDLSAIETRGGAFTIIARSCLAQMLFNETALRRTRDPEALHQLRVGLRRLRAAMSLFKPMLDDRESRAVRSELRWIGKQLGRARDLDVLAEGLRKAKRVETAESNSALKTIDTLRSDAYVALLATLSSTRFTGGLLKTATWIEIGAWRRGPKPDKPIRRMVAKALDKRWKRIRKHASTLDGLDAQHRHALRIDIKKLRYGVDFFASFFQAPSAETSPRAMLACCKALQDSLGGLNDLSIESIVLPLLGIAFPEEAKRRRIDEKKAATALRRLSALEPFWR